MKKFIGTLSIGLAMTMAIGISANAACPIKDALQSGKLEDYINCNKGICIGGNITAGSLQELLDKLGIKQETDEKPEIEESVPETDNNISAPQENASEFELKVLELVNTERTNRGLSALQWSSELAAVARAHSKDMHERSFFSHTNPDGKSPFDRIKAAGIKYSYAAENIAAGQSTPEEVVKGWMNSKGHRENILNPNLKYLGVGLYKAANGYKYYWTQNFTG